jgi:hypothetical protein
MASIRVLCEVCQTRATDWPRKTPFDPISCDNQCMVCAAIKAIVEAPLPTWRTNEVSFNESIEDNATKPPYYTQPVSPLRSDNSSAACFECPDVALYIWRYIDSIERGSQYKRWHSVLWIRHLPVPAVSRVPNARSIPYNYFRGLLDDCKQNHPECNRPVIPSKHIGPRRVIDCIANEVVEHRGEPYVTLSYVWGTAPDPPADHSRTNDFLPTIKDAMAITVSLGYRHLWVDRYCIDQSNVEEVLHQISIMHLIYETSILTIIAACGANPQLGLSGVSKPRLPLYEAESASIYVRESLRRDNEVVGSVWNSRAWTYQEALFARRRLIITSSEVYFECAAWRLWETEQVRVFSLAPHLSTCTLGFRQPTSRVLADRLCQGLSPNRFFSDGTHVRDGF